METTKQLDPPETMADELTEAIEKMDTDQLKNMLTPRERAMLRLIGKTVDSSIERKFQSIFKRFKDAVTFFFSQLGKP